MHATLRKQTNQLIVPVCDIPTLINVPIYDVTLQQAHWLSYQSMAFYSSRFTFKINMTPAYK